MLHLKESSDCFRVVQQANLSQTCVGRASFQPDASSRAELECLFQDQMYPQELKATSLLAVQCRNSALLWSLPLQWELQEGRQQLLPLTAFTNAHWLRVVVSECLVKSSVGHVRATQMVKALLWIYKMYSFKNCLRLGIFLAIWSFSLKTKH